MNRTIDIYKARSGLNISVAVHHGCVKRTGYSVGGELTLIPMKVVQWRMKPKWLPHSWSQRARARAFTWAHSHEWWHEINSGFGYYCVLQLLRRNDLNYSYWDVDLTLSSCGHLCGSDFNSPVLNLKCTRVMRESELKPACLHNVWPSHTWSSAGSAA